MSKQNQDFNNGQRDNRRGHDHHQPKEIKPVIEDDRKMTKPHYVSKEHPKEQNIKSEQKQQRQDKTHDRTEDYDRSYDRRDESNYRPV